jgi:hypothetical protein
MSLDRATGRVLRRDTLDERPTLVIEALGLREGEDVNFEMQVDVATGVVMAMPRADLGLVREWKGFVRAVSGANDSPSPSDVAVPAAPKPSRSADNAPCA